MILAKLKIESTFVKVLLTSVVLGLFNVLGVLVAGRMTNASSDFVVLAGVAVYVLVALVDGLCTIAFVKKLYSKFF